MDRPRRRIATTSVLAAFIASVIAIACGSSSTAPQNETPAQARVNADGSINLGVKTMYEVKSTDSAGNTGNKVCARVNKQCAGYTDFTLSSCLAFHPSAASTSDLDGSRAGFWCNGLPQGGVCAKEINTCHICPQCNTNMDCTTQAGDLYASMFVECQ